ncbi:MAG: S8 family serine peptidase [Betaproteobacteria bacterium]
MGRASSDGLAAIFALVLAALALPAAPQTRAGPAGPGGLTTPLPTPTPPVARPTTTPTPAGTGLPATPRELPRTTPLPIDDVAGDRFPGAQSPSATGPFSLPVLHPDTIEPGELLLAWRSRAEATEGEAVLATQFGLRPEERLALTALGWTLARYRLETTEQAASVRQQLMRTRPRWLADFNSRYPAAGTPRHYLHRQIGLVSTPADAGRRVDIGMLDGPVAELPSLQRSLAATQGWLAAGEAPAPPAHGTSVAAVISGWDPDNKFSGVAPGARLHAGTVMRVRAGIDETTMRNLLAGLDWLIQRRVQVVNMSFGGPPNRLLAAAMSEARKHSLVIVAAAGNGGPDAEPVYPAAYPGVIAVTATDALNRVYAHANHGQYVALSAPGVDVWTPGVPAGYYASGTSFAAAAVSGGVAVLLARHKLPPDRLQALLCRSALDLGVRGRDPVFGCGLLRIDLNPVVRNNP